MDMNNAQTINPVDTNAVPLTPPSKPAAKEAESRSALCVEETDKRIRHFQFFGISSFLYAVFYALCLYKNPSGITYPFYIAGTLLFFFYSLKKLEIPLKKNYVYYVIALLLLGISTFLTDDWKLHLLNKTAIFVLTFCFMIHSFCQDDNWNFSKYFLSFWKTVLGSFSVIFRPFSDCSLYLKDRQKKKLGKESKGKYVLYGFLLSIPFLSFMIYLLSCADLIFTNLVEHLLTYIRLPEHVLGVCITVFIIFLTAYSMITFLEKRTIPEDVADHRTGEPLLAITVTSMLSAVYLLFCGIQIFGLFLGNLALPDDYTYAEYARQGFFQLLLVCIINLVLVLVCLSHFKEHRVLKALLTIISLCTYVMIASSAVRMLMYIGSYHLTFLRVLVLWALLVISLLISGMLILIYKETFPLFKYSMVVVTVLYMGLSFSRPDYWIASYNTAQIQPHKFNHVDMDYLGSLSADAAPALLNLVFHPLTEPEIPEDQSEKYWYFYDLCDDGQNTCRNFEPFYTGYRSWEEQYLSRAIEISRSQNIRSFNVSRYHAVKLLNKLVSEL